MKLLGAHLSWAVLHYHEVKAAILQVATLACIAKCAPQCIAVAQQTVDAHVVLPGPTTARIVHTITTILVVGVMLYGSFALQRRVASGLPLRYSSFAAYARSAHPMNVRSCVPCASAAVVRQQRRPVAVVTGGSSGIGWWNALDLSMLGYDVLLCCRSRRRGEEAIAKILRYQQRERNDKEREGRLGSITLVSMDLEDEASIRVAAAAVLERTEGGRYLHVLINNAGMFSPTLGQRCSFGDERLVGVNFTGVVLFTELIVRAIVTNRDRQHQAKNDAAAFPSLRVVNVASIAHSWARVTPQNFFALFSECTAAAAQQSLPSPLPAVNTYGYSKLLLIAYTRALATSLNDHNTKRSSVIHGRIMVVSVHPGAVLTEIFRELGFIASHVMPALLSTIFKQPAEGAETTLFAALSSSVESGSYYADCVNMDAALSPLASDGRVAVEVLKRVRARWGLSPFM